MNTKILFAMIISLVIAGPYCFYYCYAEHTEAGKHLAPYSVHVSGYYRRDGTYINSYYRRLPGSVAHDRPYENTRSLCMTGMIVCSIITLSTPFLFLLRRKNTHAMKSDPMASSTTNGNKNISNAIQSNRATNISTRNEDIAKFTTDGISHQWSIPPVDEGQELQYRKWNAMDDTAIRATSIRSQKELYYA